MTFQERAILGKEQLSKQRPITLEEAKAQVLRIKSQGSTNNNRKKGV